MSQWGRWVKEHELGKGAFGKVYLVTTKNPYVDGSVRAIRAALKEINLSSDVFDKADKLASLKSELTMLRKLSHERIVRVYDDDVNSRNPWIAMQYLPGEELSKEVGNDGPLSEEDWLDLTEDLFEALAYTELMNVIHRDLHFNNVMRSTKGAFLIDFGISQTMGKVANQGVIGIPYFIAPEAFNPDSNWTTKIDVFSAGSVLYFAATGYIPFSQANDPNPAEFEIVKQRVVSRQCDYSKLTKLQLHLIQQMHEVNPEIRVTAASMLDQVRIAKRDYQSLQGGLPIRRTREKFVSYRKNQIEKRQAKVKRYEMRSMSVSLMRDLVRDILDEISTWLNQKKRSSFVVTTEVGKTKVTFEYFKRSADSVLLLRVDPALEEESYQNIQRTGWVDITGDRGQFEVTFEKHEPESAAASRIANTLIITLDLGVDAFANLLISPRVIR